MKTADKIVTTVYAETAALYAEIAPQLNGAARGYKILYGPPLVRPPVFFLGLQVGDVDGGPEQGEREGERTRWPAVTEYATAWWPLARKLRDIFEAGFLKTATGSNINFFRSANAETYKVTVPADVRERCEAFSRECDEQLVKATAPEKIVVIGFDVIKKLKAERQFARDEEGVQRGTLWGRPAIGVWHLTGTHMTNQQRDVICRALRNFAEVKP